MEDFEDEKTQETANPFEQLTNITQAAILGGALIYAIYTVATSAFSVKTRKEIWQEAESRSELNPNILGFRLECIHLNHDKRSARYDKKENGILGASIEHYAHHLMFMKNPHEIGLSVKDNNFAIRETCKRAEQDAKDLGYDEKQFREVLRDSRIRWQAYYKGKNAEA